MVSLRFTAEALEITPRPHILRLESFMWGWLSDALEDVSEGVVGEGRKFLTSPVKSYCVELYILLLNIAFQLGCHI